MGGQKVDFMVANSTMAIHTAVAAYTTAKGLYVTFGTDTAPLCPGGRQREHHVGADRAGRAAHAERRPGARRWPAR